MGSMRRFSNDTAYKQTKEAERYKATFFAMVLVILLFYFRATKRVLACGVLCASVLFLW